jgi:putative hydrolase of the HAD superfamily
MSEKRPAMKLSDYRVLTFDCYGTLIDWESGIVDALKPLTSRVAPALSRNQILEAHAYHESTQQLHTPARRYRDLLAIVYKRLAEQWNVTAPWDECLAYGQSVGNWPAFSDSKDALTYLKQHYKLVILSNVDNQSFAASNQKLGVAFDAIFTAEDIGSYKPSHRNFDYMTDHLGHRGFDRREILHVAESLFHDHVPANRHGLDSCWIWRRHGQDGFGATMNPGKEAKYKYRFNSMADLAAAHRADSVPA